MHRALERAFDTDLYSEYTLPTIDGWAAKATLCEEVTDLVDEVVGLWMTRPGDRLEDLSTQVIQRLVEVEGISISGHQRLELLAALRAQWPDMA